METDIEELRRKKQYYELQEEIECLLSIKEEALRSPEQSEGIHEKIMRDQLQQVRSEYIDYHEYLTMINNEFIKFHVNYDLEKAAQTVQVCRYLTWVMHRNYDHLCE